MVDDEPPFTHHLKVRPYRGIEKALDRHNELLATIAAQAAELEALRGEVAPVRHWYESDEHSPRSDVDILKDIVADLQSDRAENLKLRARVAVENTITRSRLAVLDKGLGGIRDSIILIRMLFELEEECDNRAAELTRHINALLNQNGEA